MSWIQDLGSFAKRLLTTETRVEANAQEIRELRQEIKSLTEFTQKVAYAVKRNEERAEDKRTNLVLSLKLELAQLENRLGQFIYPNTLNSSNSHPKALPEHDSRSEN